MYKKEKIKLLIFCLLGIFVTSCSDFLDVQPEDEFLENQVFSSEAGINNVLNDIYLGLTKSSLYGGQLTMSTVDVLAQYYDVSGSDHSYHNYGHYLYNEGNVKGSFDGIWSAGFRTILQINDFLVNIDKYGDEVLSPENKAILKGEALALRGMVHFDLFRLFGPIYSVNPDQKSIPYYLEPKSEGSPILPAFEVMEKIETDLNNALELLAEDPIVTNGVKGSNKELFYSNRNYRLNYYAIKALQARVYLYAGEDQLALTAATAVIDEVDDVFPWTSTSDIVSTGSTVPDRIFSKEVIFALQNVDLYDAYRSFFSPELNKFSVLAPKPGRLDQFFEYNENDYRFNPLWKLPSVGQLNFRTFFKYEEIKDPDVSFRFMQPLIRKSEMYLIVAETEQNAETALSHLNTLRFNRGLFDLENVENINEEIKKEYIREFYGEGQLFFYYKRRNVGAIPDGNSSQTASVINMGEGEYVIPLPESETKFQ